MDQFIDNCPNNLSGTSGHLFLTLINTLLASKCLLSPQEKYPADSALQLKDQDEFDFIVIGAGTAGSIVANKLTENIKWKVLVLEAGGIPSSTVDVPALLYALQKTEEDWQYTIEPSDSACQGFNGGRCRWPRGKCLGGSSSLNAMLYLRANQRDYEEWVEQGNEGWDLQSNLKYYEEIEKKLSVSRYFSTEPIVDTIKKSAKILGQPTSNQNEDIGYFTTTQTINNGQRTNNAAVFLGEIKERPNLSVALNAFVEKITIRNNKAKAVEIKINNKKLSIKARKEIILSAGAINSPQILMLSGIGPENHLKDLSIPLIKDLKVGENLQDHSIFHGMYINIATNKVNKVDAIDEIYRYFKHQKGALSNVGILNYLGFINSQNDSPYPDLEFHHLLFPQNENSFLPLFLESVGYEEKYKKIILDNNQNSATFAVYPTLAKPKSRGKILLKSSNPYDKPLIYANYLSKTYDVNVMLEGIKFIQKQLKTKPFTDINASIVDLSIDECSKFEFRTDDYWKCALKYMTNTVYHHVGTCKMGLKTDPDAVVDSRLRVHGIKGLRVIDGSIMPTLVTVNTNGPIAAIGLKGGNMITEDWERLSQRDEF